MKKTIEIEDNLQEIVDSCIEDVKTELANFLTENPDTDKTPCLNNDLDYSGAIHEIIDGAVPIYTQEINDLFYLYGAKIEEAFDNAGIGKKEDKGWPMGWKAAAIYCYIEQKVNSWYQKNADDIFFAWQENKLAKEIEDEKTEKRIKD